MPSETVLFHLHDIIVTNYRFSVGPRSFSLNSIVSLEMVEHSRSWLPAAAMALISAATTYSALEASSLTLAALAILFGIASAATWHLSTPQYSISLDTEDGPYAPLRSHDRFLVDGVIGVLQSAIEQAGEKAATRKLRREPRRRRALQVGWSVVHSAAPRVAGLPSLQPVRRRAFHPGKTA